MNAIYSYYSYRCDSFWLHVYSLSPAAALPRDIARGKPRPYLRVLAVGLISDPRLS